MFGSEAWSLDEEVAVGSCQGDYSSSWPHALSQAVHLTAMTDYQHTLRRWSAEVEHLHSRASLWRQNVRRPAALSLGHK